MEKTGPFCKDRVIAMDRPIRVMQDKASLAACLLVCLYVCLRGGAATADIFRAAGKIVCNSEQPAVFIIGSPNPGILPQKPSPP